MLDVLNCTISGLETSVNQPMPREGAGGGSLPGRSLEKVPDRFDPVLHSVVRVADLTRGPRQDRSTNAAASIMTHHNHVPDAQLRNCVRQNADGVDVVGDETVGDVTLGEERSWGRIEDGPFGHTGVAGWNNPRVSIQQQSPPWNETHLQPKNKKPGLWPSSVCSWSIFGLLELAIESRKRWFPSTRTLISGKLPAVTARLLSWTGSSRSCLWHPRRVTTGRPLTGAETAKKATNRDRKVGSIFG